MASSSTRTAAAKAESTGRRNTSIMEVDEVGVGPRQREVRRYRGQMPSPGRPTVAWRQDRVRFWAAIAEGASTGDAATAAGVSWPVGFRWFRHAGGVNPQMPRSTSGRYLSFAEREDILVWYAQDVSIRETARRLGRSPSTVSREARRGAARRGEARRGGRITWSTGP
jgi:transposase